MSYNKELSYNNLPSLPPKVEIETKEILKKVILAREALARLRIANKRLPNEFVLINSVMLQEAKISSEIENIVTTNDDLYQAMVSGTEQINPQIKEVLHYPTALWEGFNFVKKNGFLNTNLFIKLVAIIKETDSGIRKITGTKIANPISGEVIYTPPEGEKIILEKMSNLDNYINDTQDDIDPLIRMAVIHYQFESIHPFYDGNGRTGRIINILFLILNNLLDNPILYLSKYIIDNKSDYYLNLRKVTENNEWERWVAFMLDAVKETADYTEKKIENICEAMESIGVKIKNEAPNIYSRELVEVIFQLPYSKRKSLVDSGIVKEKTAGKYLLELEKIGILKSKKIGREKFYINNIFFNILKDK